MPSGTTNGAVCVAQQGPHGRQVEVVVVVVGDERRRRPAGSSSSGIGGSGAAGSGRTPATARRGRPRPGRPAPAAPSISSSALACPNQVTASSAASAGSSAAASGIGPPGRPTCRSSCHCRSRPSRVLAGGERRGLERVVELAVGEVRRAGDDRAQPAAVRARARWAGPRRRAVTQPTGPARAAAVRAARRSEAGRHGLQCPSRSCGPGAGCAGERSHPVGVGQCTHGPVGRSATRPGRRGRRPGLLGAAGVPGVRAAGRRGPADPLPGLRGGAAGRLSVRRPPRCRRPTTAKSQSACRSATPRRSAGTCTSSRRSSGSPDSASAACERTSSSRICCCSATCAATVGRRGQRLARAGGEQQAHVDAGWSRGPRAAAGRRSSSSRRSRGTPAAAAAGTAPGRCTSSAAAAAAAARRWRPPGRRGLSHHCSCTLLNPPGSAATCGAGDLRPVGGADGGGVHERAVRGVEEGVGQRAGRARGSAPAAASR